MSREIDRACQHAEKTLEHRISEHINRSVGVSAFECEECDQPIPVERRMSIAGVIRCVACQEVFELKQKHYRSI
ncbi:TraR/DksA family transcriptional regulator [Photorhabdus thracensis]|uniref:TraR/DksA family transcriptional regulator n=1 Tax=Photorhabdus thracensis TaxID=230089 RepID=UPI001E4DBCCA|nr:TraR/DksA family transcriptional regulator [Photorhabdus thracensis]MCC8421411.1 TraR/DksA family transcriptional regulator [Photorhabdus thracensis]